MSLALEKIAGDEILNKAQNWLCDCASIEDEWQYIQTLKGEDLLKLIDREYCGGLTNFLVDAFPQLR